MARKKLALCEADILRALLHVKKSMDILPDEIQALLVRSGIATDTAIGVKQLQHNIEPARFTQASRLALHHAARNGDLTEVKKLIAAGSNVNEKDLFKSTPLHMAAMYGHKAVAEYLIQHGANIDAKTYKIDNYALTPLDLAALYAPSTEMFSYLLSKGAAPEHWDILMFSLLDTVVESYDKHDYKAFDLSLNKIELAANNKNALWVYTDNEVKPIWLLHKVFAAEIKDLQYYNRIMQTVEILYANDKSNLANHYIAAKNLFHAFPSNETYHYKIGPNKVKIMASGYYSVLTVDLAANTLAAFQQQLQGNPDLLGYKALKDQFPLSENSILQSVDNFTKEKIHLFAGLENTFKQAWAAISKSGIYEESASQFKRYSQGETILLPSGWEGHALEIIIDKSLNLFMVANGGERFEGLPSGLNAYNMEFLLTANDIYSMLNNEEQVELEFKKFYDLGLVKNETYSFLFPSQVYGNCAWYSQQIAQKALLFIELSKITNDPILALSIADRWFEEYNEFHQTQVLKIYLEDPFLEVAALADILKNYHMDLSSNSEKERAKLLLDHLTDSAHNSDFEAYCKAQNLEVSLSMQNFIKEGSYHNVDFLLHKSQQSETAEVLSIAEVITWDNEMDVIQIPTLTKTVVPLVLPVLSLQDESHMVIL